MEKKRISFFETAELLMNTSRKYVYTTKFGIQKRVGETMVSFLCIRKTLFVSQDITFLFSKKRGCKVRLVRWSLNRIFSYNCLVKKISKFTPKILR